MSPAFLTLKTGMKSMMMTEKRNHPRKNKQIKTKSIPNQILIIKMPLKFQKIYRSQAARNTKFPRWRT